VGSLVVVGLDAGPRADIVDASQLLWVRSYLHGLPDRPRLLIVACHAPAHPVSEHIGSSLDARPVDRDIFWTTMVDLGAQLVISGHEHLYARREAGGLTQVISGGAGATAPPFVSEEAAESSRERHFVLVSADDERLDVTCLALTGAVIDRFTIHARTASARDRPRAAPSRR
jgi:hypothetical protein